MMNPRTAIIRWLKFNLVGAIGICVQLAALAILKSGLGLNYLLATALAVEVTIVHNFIWHERFTWANRPTRSRIRRFVAFNTSNGAISLLGSMAMMKLLVGVAGVNYFIANLFGIAACSLLNFLIGDRLVFSRSASQSM